VAVHWPNTIEAVELLFGIFKAGLIAVPINLRLKPAEIAYQFRHSEAVLCFSEPAVAPLAEQARESCPALRQILTSVPTCHSAANLPELDENLPVVILYTSGTTAQPKGGTHTHRTLAETARQIGTNVLGEGDVVLVVTSLMHAAALNCVLLPAIYQGATAALVPVFQPAAVLDAVERFRCTYTGILPALLQFVVEEQIRQPRDVSSMRSVIAGGDTVPVSLQERFQKHFGVPVQEVYGMSESLPVSINPRHAIRHGSVGVPRVETRIVDLHDRDVAPGQTGEIVVRSSSNCIGYWNDEAATANLLRGGWLHTGDLGGLDSDGYLWFRGRLKQIIVRGGSNISPQEVEEALYQHPAVLEAGVIGAPDNIYGEVVVAFVVLRAGTSAGEEELREYARQRLSDYKVPERIYFISELPKGLTGKVQRRVLKEMLAYGASAASAT